MGHLACGRKGPSQPTGIRPLLYPPSVTANSENAETVSANTPLVALGINEMELWQFGLLVNPWVWRVASLCSPPPPPSHPPEPPNSGCRIQREQRQDAHRKNEIASQRFGHGCESKQWSQRLQSRRPENRTDQATHGRRFEQIRTDVSTSCYRAVQRPNFSSTTRRHGPLAHQMQRSGPSISGCQSSSRLHARPTDAEGGGLSRR